MVVSFLLLVVIMVQNPKGGGLSSSFGGGGTQQLGGVRKTGEFLDKSTWVLATSLLVLILLASTTLIQSTDSKVREIIKQEPKSQAAPVPQTPQGGNTATPIEAPATGQ